MTAVSPGPSVVGTPAPQRRGHTLLGSLLVIAGAVLLLAQVGVLASPWPAIPALLLVAAGGAIALEGFRGVWHGGLVGLAVILTFITALSTTAANSWHMTAGGMGDRMHAPLEMTDLEEHYELGAGTLVVDLRQLTLPEGTTPLTADVGMGEIEVRVPDDVAVNVTADAGTGEIVLFGEQEGGLGLDRTYATPGYEAAGRKLQLELNVGMGRIEVTR